MNADANLNLDALNKQALKNAMGCFATGVTVVTTNVDGQDFGMTCNSFNTVSLDPAMVLWSIRRASTNFDIYTRAKGYTVNILAASQQEDAMRFAKGTQEERFDGVDLRRLQSGRLNLVGATAWFDCEMHNVVEAGDHDILIGRVLSFASNGAAPLGYLNGKFVDLA